MQMMENMQLEEGDLLTVRNACLDKVVGTTCH